MLVVGALFDATYLRGMPDLTTTITDVAQAPAEIQSDNTRVKEHSLPDLIEADRYAKGQAAAATKKKWWGLRVAKLVPPGAD